MSSIKVTHADSGLVLTTVAASRHVSPHIVRVTLGGGDLDRFAFTGFDQWFRLAIPVHASDRFDNLPARFGVGGLVKYLTLSKGTRPVIRNYTVRQYRSDPAEIDIDFVMHGDKGIASPWAASVKPGAKVAFIDQGHGWAPVDADQVPIVADESGMAAALGILRDLPRDTVGDAIIEIFDECDEQEHEAPEGVNVQWLVRDPSEAPGTLALPALRALPPCTSLYAFAVGESALATGTRRYLVNELGLPRANVTFCGYWRIGRSSPS